MAWLRRLGQEVIRWSRRLAGLVFLIIFGIVIFAPHAPKITENPYVIAGCALAVLTAIVAHLVDLAIQAESIQKKLELLKEAGSEGRLFTLSEAIADLFQALERVGTNHIILTIFALHLSSMSGWLFEALRRSKIKSIEINIFLITHDSTKLGSFVPYEVEKACSNMPNDLERRKQAFQELSKEMKDQHRQLTVKIKHYHTVPLSYGISVREPILLSYINFCRHGDSPDVEYYRRIDHATATPADNDLGEAFCKLFDLLWNKEPEPPWVDPPLKPQKSDRKKAEPLTKSRTEERHARELPKTTPSEPSEAPQPPS